MSVFKVEGVDDIFIVCGGVILFKDYDEFKVVGVFVIFGLGMNILNVVCEIFGFIWDKCWVVV